VLTAHTALVILFAHKSLTHLTTQLIGVAGDSAQFAWGVTYTPWALAQGHTPLLTSLVEAPAGVNLMWNTSTPLLGILGAPVTFLGGPVLGYNLILLTVLVANCFSCYIALRRFAPNRLPRFAASLFYGFSPYLVPHANGHLNLTSILFVPVLLVLLHELLIRRRWGTVKLGLALGVTLGAQLLITEELLASEAIAAFTGLVVLVALFPRETRQAVREGVIRRVLTASGLAVTILAVVAAYPLYVQFLGPRRLERGLIHQTDAFVGDLGQLWFPTFQWSARLWGLKEPPFTGGPGEWNAHLGIPLMLAVLLSAIWLWRRRPIIRWAVVFAVTMTVLSFGPSLHVYGKDTGVWMPWAAVQEIWLFGSLLPARLSLFCDLAIALVLAVAIRELARLTRARIMAAVVVLGIPIVFTLWPVALQTTPASTPSFFTSNALHEQVQEGSTVMLLPLTAEGNGTPNDSASIIWHAQADFWFAMTGGYWLNPNADGDPQIGPTRTPMLQRVLDIQNGRPVTVTPDVRTSDVAELRAQQIDQVILGPMQRRFAMRWYVTSLLGPPDAEVGGVSIWNVKDGGRP
jgi:hypothetical protein